MPSILEFLKNLGGTGTPREDAGTTVYPDRQPTDYDIGSYATSDTPIPIWGPQGPQYHQDEAADLNREQMQEQDPRDHLEQIMIQKGLDAKTRAVLLGNIAVETGGSYDHEQLQEHSISGRPSVGLFQFEPDGIGLHAPYQQYLADTQQEDSAEAQISFISDVIREDYTPGVEYIGRGNIQTVKQALTQGSLEDAVTEFSNRVLRPGVPHLERRIHAARDYWNTVDDGYNPTPEENIMTSPEVKPRDIGGNDERNFTGSPDEQAVAIARGFVQWYGNLEPVDKAAVATAPIPLVGDVVGTAADVKHFADEPSLANFGWLAAGVVVPFVGGKALKEAKDALLGNTQNTGEVVNFSQKLAELEDSKAIEATTKVKDMQVELDHQYAEMLDNFKSKYNLSDKSVEELAWDLETTSIEELMAGADYTRYLSGPTDPAEFIKDLQVLDQTVEARQGVSWDILRMEMELDERGLKLPEPEPIRRPDLPSAEIVQLERFKDLRPSSFETLHGTNMGFEVYDLTKGESLDAGWFGAGVYTTPQPEFADKFSLEYRNRPGLNQEGINEIETFRQDLIDLGEPEDIVFDEVQRFAEKVYRDPRYQSGPNTRLERVSYKKPFVVKWDGDIDSESDAKFAMIKNLQTELEDPRLTELVEYMRENHPEKFISDPVKSANKNFTRTKYDLVSYLRDIVDDDEVYADFSSMRVLGRFEDNVGKPIDELTREVLQEAYKGHSDVLEYALTPSSALYETTKGLVEKLQQAKSVLNNPPGPAPIEWNPMTVTTPEITEFLKSRGYDGVAVSNPRLQGIQDISREDMLKDLKAGNPDLFLEIMVYDPENVRSVFQSAEVVDFPGSKR